MEVRDRLGVLEPTNRGRRRQVEIDRKALSTALAKAVAYKQCGSQRMAEEWGRELIKLLELERILIDYRD